MEWIGGRTDRCDATLNVAPSEGHTFYHVPILSERDMHRMGCYIIVPSDLAVIVELLC